MLENLGRLPLLTASGLTRWFSPGFRLERQAKAEVRRWLSRERWSQLCSIPGMSATQECLLLAFLAAKSPSGGAIVEIGAWQGKSTAWLAEGARRRSDRPLIVSIDPHERGSWEGFVDTIQRFDLQGHKLKVHRTSSHAIGESWDRPISLLWVDGCREYDAVRQDIDDFVPHLMRGGWAVFDDAAGGAYPGVERAIAERLAGRRGFSRAATIRQLQIFRRDL
ncbi:MAG TPA: class I SAM-dependent methyltransferase [Pirellulales bacterium]|nr:class I SAM-dependent methyltransferase [Pirellulales bacterium]